MVELVFSVINNVVSLKFAPQMPNTNARKINVKAMGKPIKITKSIAPSIIRPMVGLERLGRALIKSVNQAPPGTMSGAKTANTSQIRRIR